MGIIKHFQSDDTDRPRDEPMVVHFKSEETASYDTPIIKHFQSEKEENPWDSPTIGHFEEVK
jgi:hypothetical protein